MLIRKALIIDAKDIYEWRNDNHTRAMSIQNDPVNWKHHLKWFNEILKSDNKYIYIGFFTEKKESCGMARFDIKDGKKEATVSINLNPYWRGKRLSVELLSLAINEFRKINKMTLLATIKKNNLGSIKCFERCNFVEYKQDAACAYYKLI